MKKTNIRARRNTGSKPASAQAPNKTDSVPGQNQKPAPEPRFEGTVKYMLEKRELASGGVGLIIFSPEPGKTAKAVFLLSELPEGRALDLREGGRVSFRLARNETGWRAMELSAITLAPELPEVGWKPATVEFLLSTIELHEPPRCKESLVRDQSARLYVIRSPRKNVNDFLEVTFEQACAWLVNHDFEMIPERFLERHGILEQSRLARRSEGLNKLKINDAVSDAFTLIELMELQLTKEDDSAMVKDRKDAFISGLINLRHHVQEQLLALQSDYNAVRKGKETEQHRRAA